MKYFLDTANVEEIRKAAELGIIDGVTTNPSLIAREGRDFKGLIVSAVQQMRDDGVHFGRISSGEYAVFEIDHTAQALALAWSQLFLELGKSGYQLDQSRPIIERYAAIMVKNHRCEICVPIGGVKIQ